MKSQFGGIAIDQEFLDQEFTGSKFNGVSVDQEFTSKFGGIPFEDENLINRFTEGSNQIIDTDTPIEFSETPAEQGNKLFSLESEGTPYNEVFPETKTLSQRDVLLNQIADPFGEKPVGESLVEPKIEKPSFFTPEIKQEYPETVYNKLIKSSAEKHGVPFHIAYKLFETESGFDPKARSEVGAEGIAQFMPATAKEQGVDSFDPNSAIPGALKYLKKQYNKFGNWNHAVAAYNAGRATVIKYKGIPPFKETEDYVKKVMSGYVPEEKEETPKDFTEIDSIFSRDKKEEENFKEIKYSDEKLKQGTYKPNFIERTADAFSKVTGLKQQSKISSRTAAQNVIKLLAKDEGVSVGEFTEKPEFISTAAQGFTDAVTLGIPSAIKETMTGEEKTQSYTVLDHAGQALGSLGGLLMGPFAAAKEAVGAFKLVGRGTQEGKMIANVLKEMLHDGVILGVASGLSQTGEALKETTFTDAAKKLKDATRSGAFTGMIFGASRGLFPKEGVQKGARLITGLVGLNAQRALEVGGNPFTNRPVGEVIFDTALDAVFLWKGLSSKKFARLTNIVTDPKSLPKLIDTTVKESLKEAKESLIKKSVEKRVDKLIEKHTIESKEKIVKPKKQLIDIAKKEIKPVEVISKPIKTKLLKVDKSQQSFINKKIIKLGSLKAVKRQYQDMSSDIDIYARQKAAEVYNGETEIIKPIEKIKPTKDKFAIVGKGVNETGKVIPFKKEWLAKKAMRLVGQKSGTDVTGFKVFEKDDGWVFQKKESKWDGKKEFPEKKVEKPLKTPEKINLTISKPILIGKPGFKKGVVVPWKKEFFAVKATEKKGKNWEVVGSKEKGFLIQERSKVDADAGKEKPQDELTTYRVGDPSGIFYGTNVKNKSTNKKIIKKSLPLIGKDVTIIGPVEHTGDAGNAPVADAVNEGLIPIQKDLLDLAKKSIATDTTWTTDLFGLVALKRAGINVAHFTSSIDPNATVSIDIRHITEKELFKNLKKEILPLSAYDPKYSGQSIFWQDWKVQEKSKVKSPELILKTLTKPILNEKGSVDISSLQELGEKFYIGGKQNYFNWQKKMKSALGNLWEKVKKSIRKIWKNLKRPLKSQEGSILIKNKKIFNPLSGYLGNKVSMLKAGAYNTILPKISNYNTVIEPFAGSGILGSVLTNNTKTKVLLNDTNKSLINFHKTTKNSSELINKEIKLLASKIDKIKTEYPNGGIKAHKEILKFWAELNKIINNPKSFNSKKAAAYIITQNGSTSIGGFQGLISSHRAKIPYQWKTKRNSINLLPFEITGFSKQLQNTKMSNEEASVTIAKAKKGDLLIIDPPYVGKRGQVYIRGYNKKRPLNRGKGLTNINEAIDFIHNNLTKAINKGVDIVYTNTNRAELAKTLKSYGFDINYYNVNSRGSKGKRQIRQEIVATYINKKSKSMVNLYSGLDPIYTVKEIGKLIKDGKDVTVKLEELGRKYYTGGKQSYFDWQKKMKTVLGNLWEKVKKYIQRIWKDLKVPITNQKGSITLPTRKGKEVKIRPEYIGKDFIPFKLRKGDKQVNIGKEANKNIKVGTSDATRFAALSHKDSVVSGFTPTDYMFDKYPEVRNLIDQTREIDKTVTKELENFAKKLKVIEKKYPSIKLRKDTGIDWHYDNKLGAEAMEKLKHKRPENVEYKDLREELQVMFTDLIKGVNKVRVKLGKKPIKISDNYLTFYATENYVTDFMTIAKGGDVNNLVLDSFGDIQTRQGLTTKDSTAFGHKKKVGLRTGVKLELDPLVIINRYAREALNHIHKSPLIAFTKEMLKADLHDPVTGKKISIGGNTKTDSYNPIAAANISSWINKWAGKSNLNLPRNVERLGQKAMDNLTTAQLLGNLRTTIVQSAALVPTGIKFGYGNTARGAIDALLVDKISKETPIPYDKSSSLPTASWDVAADNMANAIGRGKIGKTGLAMKETSAFLMKGVDYLARKITFATVYRSLLPNIKNGKLTEKQAVRIADAEVIRTQGSGSITEISPIQRNVLGKMATLWQTHTINQANFFFRDVVGVGGKKISKGERVKRVFRTLVGIATMTLLYEKIMGIQSPFPAPSSAILQSMEEDDNVVQLTRKLLLELSEGLPIGGSVKFGSSILGPILQHSNEIVKALSGRGDFNQDLLESAFSKNPKIKNRARVKIVELIGKTSGVPGTAQWAKYVRGRMRGEGHVRAAVGRIYGKGIKIKTDTNAIRRGQVRMTRKAKGRNAIRRAVRRN